MFVAYLWFVAVILYLFYHDCSHFDIADLGVIFDTTFV